MRHTLPHGSSADHERDLIRAASAEAALLAKETVLGGRRARTRRLPQIAGYRILGVIGQGGMGIVYRAVQEKLNRTVALKVLPAIVGDANPSAVIRFRHEATAAARLHHPNIVPIYDFGESPEGSYYAMELVRGQSLDRLARRFGQLHSMASSAAEMDRMFRDGSSDFWMLADADAPPDDGPVVRHEHPTFSAAPRDLGYYRQVACWLAEAADALHYAHAEGIVHRDIKPGNLILSEDGRIMVADFGLAKSRDHEASVTLTGAVVGTLRYLSPEQAAGDRRQIDHRTDIYSLGATMYELLSFSPAFPGVDEKQLLAAVLTREPPSPRKLAPEVPRDLETICRKALEKAPVARYQVARDLSEDLRRFVENQPIVAKRPAALARAVKWSRRHRWLTTAMATSAFLLVLLAAQAVWTRGLSRDKQVLAKQVDIQKDAARAKDAAGVLVRDGIVAMGKGVPDFGLAEAKFREALRLDPGNVQAWGNLARVRREQYNQNPVKDQAVLGEALEYCERALSFDPAKAGAWNVKGILLKMLNRPREAIAAYHLAISFEPLNAQFWNNLAEAHALVGDLATTEDCLVYSAQLASETGTECYAWRDLASLYFFQGRTEAQAAIEHAITCDPTRWQASLIRTKALLESDPPAAHGEALIADRLAQGVKPLVKRVLALAALKVDLNVQAVAAATAALELGDEPVINQLVLAVAQSRLSHDAAAAEAFQEAMMAWSADLEAPDGYRVTAPEGILWFDTAEELYELYDEAAGEFGYTVP